MALEPVALPQRKLLAAHKNSIPTINGQGKQGKKKKQKNFSWQQAKTASTTHTSHGVLRIQKNVQNYDAAEAFRCPSLHTGTLKKYYWNEQKR